MKNKLKSTKGGSKTAAASQPKTSPSTSRRRANAPPSSASHCIALFPEVAGDIGGLSEDIVDLSPPEYAALKRAAAPAGDGILMFMANAALEKAAWRGSSSPSKGGLTVAVQLADGSETRVKFTSEERRRINAVLTRTGISLQHFMNMALEHFLGFADHVNSLSVDELIERLDKETRTRPTGQRRAA